MTAISIVEQQGLKKVQRASMMIPQSTAERLCMELFVAALVFPPWEHFFGLIALILTIGALARAIGIVVIAILSEQQEER